MEETSQDPERERAVGDQRRAHEERQRPGAAGPEGGPDSPDAQELPSHPTDSDSELGDTDQHSNA